MSSSNETLVREVLDEFGDGVAAKLREKGLPPHASPVHRPFSLAVILGQNQILAGFSPESGMANLIFNDNSETPYALGAITDLVRNQLGRELLTAVALPRPDAPDRKRRILIAVAAHVGEVEKLNALSRLGDISHVEYLERYMRTFLEDHPDPARNVFVMMRFTESPQMREIFATIKTTLDDRGLTAVRADDRDYTGELWSNIEVYLTGCDYGLAVFEDIDQRDYNPNVSLELGYLMGRGKRTVLLKEKRLPRLPTDVVHRLYKEFDVFDIENSVAREVARWVDVDLRIAF